MSAMLRPVESDMHVFFSLCGVDSLTLNVLGRLLADKYSCILIWVILNRGYAEHYLFRCWIAVREEKTVSDCQSIRKTLWVESQFQLVLQG